MKIIVGITGATGAIFGVRILESLNRLNVETHLILSKWAETTIKLETNYSVKDIQCMASVVHSSSNLAAPISSGSFRTDGMVIAPCSMKTLAAIRVGYTDNLITRAADVVLKERGKLVLMAREAPLNEIHLENMTALSRAGAIIMPPMMAFYNQPQTLDDAINHIVARTLDQFGIESNLTKRWGAAQKD